MSNICGVLAMQGGYAKHRDSLARCAAPSMEVRSLNDLRRCERLILPGGESSTMYRLLIKAGLWQPLIERAQAGMPMFGTCAGMILLSRHVAGVGKESGLQENKHIYGEQPCLAAINLEVQRNAYGRQISSFSAELDLACQAPEEPKFIAFLRKQRDQSAILPLIFIRAPQAVSWGPELRVLLRYPEPRGAEAVCLQQDNVLVCSFHPELGDSTVLHQYFLSL